MPTPAIDTVGLEGRDPTCDEALDMFVEAYGFEAGNLALKFKATGGVFLGGGIAPKILDRLREPLFDEAFLHKGSMRDLVAAIPVRVVVAHRAGVLGAARYAAVKAGLL
jgi:glucokinase